MVGEDGERSGGLEIEMNAYKVLLTQVLYFVIILQAEYLWTFYANTICFSKIST